MDAGPLSLLGIAFASKRVRRVAASFSPQTLGVHRVVHPNKLAGEWDPALRFAVLVKGADEQSLVEGLHRAGAGNIGWISSHDLQDGDIVVLQQPSGHAVVLLREADVHHSLLVTNRCNSCCLMCSQPPTPQDDAWRISEAFEVLRHLRASPQNLGLTGGEPLLLGPSLRGLLDYIATNHPDTSVDILSNGRRLSDSSLAGAILKDLPAGFSWLVPLYGHADFLHEFVVQAPGAFDETIGGLLALQEYRQAIQLRIVLIEPVLRVLPELCTFIGRNLPFVREVALMACEPIGFALANRTTCEVDLGDWSTTIEEATRVLSHHGVPFIFMNTPLCTLPRKLWPWAHKSISDWKNTFVEECSDCAVREQCSGLFAWHERGWKPGSIRAIEEAELT